MAEKLSNRVTTAEEYTELIAALEKARGWAPPTDEEWEALSDGERASLVRAERVHLHQIQKGLHSDSKELRAACVEKVNEMSRPLIEAMRAAFIEITLTALPDLSFDEQDGWEAISRAIGGARPEWQITSETSPADVLNLLRQEIEKQKQAKRKRRKVEVEPLAKDTFIRAPADRFNKAAIESFMTGAMLKATAIQPKLDALEARGLTESNQFWAAYPIETKANDLHGAIGFTKDPGEAIWNLLQKNGALAVKAQYALWARAYADTDALPHQFIKIPITQFCDDLGFKRKKRAHTKENKQAAMRVLELLTSLELIAVYQPPQGTTRRLRGPLWSRGIIAEEMDGYADLFGSNRVPGTKAMWEPVAFSYAPGPFFADEVWRAYNKNVALIGEGLLKLNADNEDKWAVMIGGYVAILARMNGYRSTNVGVRFLLEKTGLWSVNGESNPGRMRDKLERALDRVRGVGLIREWKITTPPEGVNPDDFTSDETLTSLAEPTRWTKNWLGQCVIIDWPPDMERRAGELKAKKSKAIAGRRGRKPRFALSANKGGI